MLLWAVTSPRPILLDQSKKMFTPPPKCGRSAKIKDTDSQMFMVSTVNTPIENSRCTIKSSQEKMCPLHQLTAKSLIKLHISHYQV